MKYSITLIALAAISVLVSACSSVGSNVSQVSDSDLSATPVESKSYTGIGTYYFTCPCDERPPSGGAAADGICYPPGSKYSVSPQDPNEYWPDFTVTSGSPAYPNNYTQNGYEFWLDPLDEVTFEFNCPSEGIAGVRFDKNGSVSCKKIGHTSNSRTVQCKNKSKKDSHHLNIKDFKYKDGS